MTFQSLLTLDDKLTTVFSLGGGEHAVTLVSCGGTTAERSCTSRTILSLEYWIRVANEELSTLSRAIFLCLVRSRNLDFIAIKAAISSSCFWDRPSISHSWSSLFIESEMCALHWFIRMSTSDLDAWESVEFHCARPDASRGMQGVTDRARPLGKVASIL